MAEVEPLRALHYDLDKTGGLQAVVAPPYDVIDADQRPTWWPARRTTSSGSTCRSAIGDPYEHAARLLSAWRAEGVVVRDDQPALWPLEQDTRDPTGDRARGRGSSRACASRITDRAGSAPTSAPTPVRRRIDCG